MKTSCGKCFVASVLGAIVLFLWGYASWMVLPWHHSTLKTFKDDVAVSQVIKANVSESGVYISPVMNPNNADIAGKTLIFTNIDVNGMPSNSMTMPMIISFITQLIAAFLVTWLLANTAGMGYLRRVAFVVVFALAASIVTNVPAWNWFKFDTHFTLVAMADLVIGWFLAGIFIAALVKGKR